MFCNKYNDQFFKIPVLDSIKQQKDGVIWEVRDTIGVINLISKRI